MKRAVLFFTLFVFFSSWASADTLVLKSGERKTGKVLEETDKRILLEEPGGLVVEVPRPAISIFDHDGNISGGQRKGSVSFFSTPPRKKKPSPPPDAGITPEVKEWAQGMPSDKARGVKKPFDQAGSFEALEKFIERWVREHPEMAKVIQETMTKFNHKSDEMDRVVAEAKKATDGG